MQFKNIKNQVKRILTLILNLISGLIFVVPHSKFFDISSEPYQWRDYYILNDVFMVLIISPLIVSWILMQISNDTNRRKFFKRTTLILAIIYSGYAFLSNTLPAQDYSPGLGVLLIMLFLPIFLVIFYTEKIEEDTESFE